MKNKSPSGVAANAKLQDSSSASVDSTRAITQRDRPSVPSKGESAHMKEPWASGKWSIEKPDYDASFAPSIRSPFGWLELRFPNGDSVKSEAYESLSSLFETAAERDKLREQRDELLAVCKLMHRATLQPIGSKAEADLGRESFLAYRAAIKKVEAQ